MGHRVEFAVSVDALDDRVVVRVAGDLDLASAATFDDALADAVPAEHVVIDLSECTFLDSTGMRAIAETVRQAPRVSIVATDPGVLRVLEITALDTLVDVYPSLDAAL